MKEIEDAIKIAQRSTIRTHKTGAVIFNRNGLILSNGWSHTPHYKLSNGKRSIHAEIHALARGRQTNLNGALIAVATVSGKSGNCTTGMPCLDCAIALRAADISGVYYTCSDTPFRWMNLLTDTYFDDLKVYQAA